MAHEESMAQRHGHLAAVRTILIFLFVIATIGLIGIAFNAAGRLSRNRNGDVLARHLRVAVSSAPLEDMARAIGGDRAEIVPFLSAVPRAADSRSFEIDTVAVRSADIIIFGGPLAEPETAAAFGGLSGVHARIVNAAANARLLADPAVSGTVRGDGVIADPAFWLDADNALAALATIRDALIAADSDGARGYRERGEIYAVALREADLDAAKRLRSCRTRTFIEGGAPQFAYLARRYGFEYYASGADPVQSFAFIMDLARLADERAVPFIFFDRAAGSAEADVIAKFSDAGALPLESGDIPASHGLAFQLPEALRANTDAIVRGLECQNGF